MMSRNDFKEKQIVFVNLRDGQKLAFKNENLIVKDSNDKIILQTSCYQLFSLFIIGNISITSVLLHKSQKYCFSIVLMSYSFRHILSINNGLLGNTLLHKKQYDYISLEIGKHIILNKIKNQRTTLNLIRSKSEFLKQGISNIDSYIDVFQTSNISDLNSIMSIEAVVAKQYFKCLFEHYNWKGRKPRVKLDYINVILDIGYTLLFHYIEAVLSLFDFDLYVGVFHREFYKRKSLVCDLIEPFRYIIDEQVLKSLNLKQFNEKDFGCSKGVYYLKYEKNKVYINVFIRCISDNKMLIFQYIQSYYRFFMKGLSVENFPVIKR